MIDTTSAHGRLMLGVLAAIGEFERELIRSRVEDGTAHARARGVKFGRKPKLNRHQREEIAARLKAGETQAYVARSLQRRSIHDQQAGGGVISLVGAALRQRKAPGG